MVFWNASRGDIIGLVWKPRSFLAPHFSILDSKDLLMVPSLGAQNAASSDVTSNDGGAVINVAKIVSEILEIGQGLFGDIHIQ